MLRTDAGKLRWMGVDMRARWRRRVAVVLTYVAYGVVVWVHPRGTDKSLLLMLMAVYGQAMLTLTKEVAGTAARRILLGALCVGALPFLWGSDVSPSPMPADVLAFFLIVVWSALGSGRLVDVEWRRNWFARRFEGRSKHLKSLDDFARYYFGESFAELAAEQQMEVGRLHRASPMGDWVKPGSGRFPVVEDERLRHEDDRLRAQVQRWMVWILTVSAVVWDGAETMHFQVAGGTIAAWAWTMATLAATLRQAIVLWTEPGVSGAGEEMRLIEG